MNKPASNAVPSPVAPVAAKNKQLSAPLHLTAAQEAKLALTGKKRAAQVVGQVGSVYKNLGLEQLNLNKAQLTGAVLELLERAKDPLVLAIWEKTATAYKAATAVAPGLKCFIHCKHKEGELAELCKTAGMRFSTLPRGFSGRATLDQLVDIGKRFGVSIGVLLAGTETEIVRSGVVDVELVQKLRAASDEPTSGGSLPPAVPPATPATVQNARPRPPGGSLSMGTRAAP